MIIVIDAIEITIHASCTVEELVARNLENAMQSKETILYELQQALMYEQACSDIIKELRNDNTTQITRPDLNKAQNQVDHAMVFENISKKSIVTSVENLLTAVDIFVPDSLFIERLEKYLDPSPVDTEKKSK